MPTGAGAEMLSAVKYSTIKPMGKTENYKPGERISFDISDRYSYFSGKNSYLYVEVENNSQYSDAVGATNVRPQVMFPPHTGAHALFSRVQYQEKMTAKDLEDIDAYNLYVGLMKSHAYDFEEYDAMARVEGVSAHNPLPHHRCAGDVNNQYFQTPPQLAPSTSIAADSDKLNELSGGTTDITASFCLPIHLGMWSGFGDDNQVLPNGPLGGTQLHLYLEDPDVCLNNVSNKVTKSDTAIYDYINHTRDNILVNCKDAIANANTLDYFVIKDFKAKALAGDEDTAKDIAFRVGQVVFVTYDVVGAANPVSAQREIAQVHVCSTGSTLTNPLDTLGALEVGDIVIATKIGAHPDATVIAVGGNNGERVADTLKINLAPETKDYTISKIELRVLETMPSNPKALAGVLARGMNYKSVVLNKMSTPGSLQNVILNLPASNTKALSFFCCPNVQASLKSSNDSNTYLYPQQEDSVDYEYVWQIGNNLIPNRPVVISKDVNKKSDNVVHYSQAQMATRPMYDCHAVNDGTIPDVKELGNPLFIPLLLAPMGNSFNLLNQEGQLRIEHKASTLSDVESKLWHLFCNHTRMVRLLDNSVEVDI